mgnify:CR=1 FL=1|tara:strand:- start:1662 stop:2465 length:804 start_codon:yes stop_codon:yes gene_type:complete
MSMYGTLIHTPSMALRALARETSQRGGLEALGAIHQAMRSEAGITARDLEAIATGEAHPDLGTLQGIARGAGLPVQALAYRSLMTREATEEEEPGYRFTMSTAEPDRADDIVDQVWSLDAFKANPVAPFGHMYHQPVVGIWRDVEVVGGRLVGVLVPRVYDSYPLSQTVAQQLADGTIQTVSVGFVPGVVTPRAAFDEDDPRYGRRGSFLSSNHLLECSPVPIPMQPQASRIRAAPAPTPEPWTPARLASPEQSGWSPARIGDTPSP